MVAVRVQVEEQMERNDGHYSKYHISKKRQFWQRFLISGYLFSRQCARRLQTVGYHLWWNWNLSWDLVSTSCTNEHFWLHAGLDGFSYWPGRDLVDRWFGIEAWKQGISTYFLKCLKLRWNTYKIKQNDITRHKMKRTYNMIYVYVLWRQLIIQNMISHHTVDNKNTLQNRVYQNRTEWNQIEWKRTEKK